MTTVELPPAVESTATDSYRAAIDACTEADRAYASIVASNVIEVVKAFNSVKGRLHGQTHPDTLDLALLIRLVKEGPMRASDLSEQLCADPSTVSRQVASLVKAGLIERKADPKDGRASILVPTEAGLDRIAQFVQLRGQIFAPIVAHWSAEDRAVFARLLTEFVSGLSTNLEALKNVATELIQQGALARRNV